MTAVRSAGVSNIYNIDGVVCTARDARDRKEKDYFGLIRHSLIDIDTKHVGK